MTVSELLEGFPCQTSAGEEGWLMQVKLELHRNIRGMRFPSACGQQEKRRASQVVKNAMDQRNSSETDKMDCLGLAGLSENERELLADKGWLPAGGKPADRIPVDESAGGHRGVCRRKRSPLPGIPAEPFRHGRAVEKGVFPGQPAGVIHRLCF